VKILNGFASFLIRRVYIYLRDLMLGVRHFFNDFDNKQVFLRLIADVDGNNVVITDKEYNQRTSENWKIKMNFRYNFTEDKGDAKTGREAIYENNFVALSLSRVF